MGAQCAMTVVAVGEEKVLNGRGWALKGVNLIEMRCCDVD